MKTLLCKDHFVQLHEACDRNDESHVTEVLRLVYLRGHTCKFNVQDNMGYTPLLYACYNGHSGIVETLVLARADKTITNYEGKTPAQVSQCLRAGYSELLKLLDGDSLWQVILW